jgi:MFS family permease
VTAGPASVPVGRLLERHGPRQIMTAGSVTGVVALVAVVAAPGPPWFFAAWLLAGLAQSALLYPPAFAVLTRWYGPDRVRALTTLSLVVGLSGTVFAPPTAVLVLHLGWRAAYLVLAVPPGAVTIPLHALCPRLPWPAG